jgi:hypothetical protein
MKPKFGGDNFEREPVSRRMMIRGGLAGFATIMAGRALPSCSPNGINPRAGTDAGAIDAGAGMNDAGAIGSDSPGREFPPRTVPEPRALRSRISEVGPLGEPDSNGLRLPSGFTSRVIARSGEAVIPGSYVWHRLPDGGATYAAEDGGWIYVSNSEVPLVGGVSAIRFDATGAIRSAYRILERTHVNCAGGKTPWHTWLSCEEISRGRVYECDPWGEVQARVRPALGVFKHEAAAIDVERGHVYLTEDETDGRLYRFVPDRRIDGHPDLASGRLDVAVVNASFELEWVPLPDPQYERGTPTRMQIPESTAFRGGEGIWYHDGFVYFSTKYDNRVWAYDVTASRISVLYDGNDPRLRGVDNLTVSCCGDVIVAEDAGSMQLVAIIPGSGELRPLVQIAHASHSEMTGPAFDPSGTRLYFSSQRSGSGGITYEVEGPFHAPIGS